MDSSYYTVSNYQSKEQPLMSQNTPPSSAASTRLIRSSPSSSQCDEVSLDTDSLYSTIPETNIYASNKNLPTRHVSIKRIICLNIALS